jgi:hypothetical protein
MARKIQPVVKLVWDQMAEDDRDEEAADGGEREHESCCRSDIRVINPADSRRHGQPRGESEDHEEPDPDPEQPERRVGDHRGIKARSTAA